MANIILRNPLPNKKETFVESMWVTLSTREPLLGKPVPLTCGLANRTLHNVLRRGIHVSTPLAIAADLNRLSLPHRPMAVTSTHKRMSNLMQNGVLYFSPVARGCMVCGQLNAALIIPAHSKASSVVIELEVPSTIKEIVFFHQVVCQRSDFSE
jgi:hypothetical protein